MKHVKLSAVKVSYNITKTLQLLGEVNNRRCLVRLRIYFLYCVWRSDISYLANKRVGVLWYFFQFKLTQNNLKTERANSSLPATPQLAYHLAVYIWFVVQWNFDFMSLDSVHGFISPTKPTTETLNIPSTYVCASCTVHQLHIDTVHKLWYGCTYKYFQLQVSGGGESFLYCLSYIVYSGVTQLYRHWSILTTLWQGTDQHQQPIRVMSLHTAYDRKMFTTCIEWIHIGCAQ